MLYTFLNAYKNTIWKLWNKEKNIFNNFGLHNSSNLKRSSKITFTKNHLNYSNSFCKSYCYELLPKWKWFFITKRRKERTIRNLVKIFFECLKDLKGLNVLGKIAWALCSHQSFVDNGVLVQSELDNMNFWTRTKILKNGQEQF